MADKSDETIKEETSETKNLFKVCRNKVLVNFSIAWTVEDFEKMIEEVRNSSDSSNTRNILMVLVDCKKAITKTLAEGNK